MGTNTETTEAWKNFVARYFEEEAYAEQAHANPAEVLKEAGVPIPAGKRVNLLKNTDDEIHLVMPAAMPSELDNASLEGVVAGFFGGSTCTTSNGGIDANISSGPYLGIPTR